MDAELSNRISSAAFIYSKLQKIWKDKKLDTLVKVSFYRACVLSRLLYMAETWTLRTEQYKRIELFHM